MRVLGKISAAVALIALGSGAFAIAAEGDPQQVNEILSGIDFVPAKDKLDEVLGGEADGDLLAIARDPANNTDPGIRIRAYRALVHYPSADVTDALRLAVHEHSQGEGIETLYARASIEALARVSGESALSDITPLLDHPGRDVRAAAARALRGIGSVQSVPALRARLQVEQVVGVQLAISEAIRAITATEQ